MRLQNEDNLIIMFEDLRNTGGDHFCASSGFIPEHSSLINLDGGDYGGQSDIESESSTVQILKQHVELQASLFSTLSILQLVHS
jgi:hypothetical protein